MMKQGHYSAASPVGLGTAWVMVLVGVNAFIALCCAGIVVWSSTWNDLDHPRFKGKMHPAAALVRGTSRYLYQIRTEHDKVRGDVHRGPSHCIEWCAALGALVAIGTSYVPPLAPWSVWWGTAVALGTFSHVLADTMTPTGVPFSAIFNYVVYREVWRRHTVNWFSTDSGAEKFGAVPILYLLSIVIMLAMVGWLGPIVGWLIGKL
jgi:hypothetical protein